MKITIALLVLGAALCCYRFAHAQSASDSLLALCPDRIALASTVEDAASASRVSAVVLVAMGYVESSCGKKLVNLRSQSYGFIQIKIDGSANVDHLEADDLLDPATNLRLGAKHLKRMVSLCGSLAGGLTVYHGRKESYQGRGRCLVDGYARKVLALVARARALIAKMGERRT
jgi:hypothetical protein